jgi:hypothetical protein
MTKVAMVTPPTRKFQALAVLPATGKTPEALRAWVSRYWASVQVPEWETMTKTTAPKIAMKAAQILYSSKRKDLAPSTMLL